MKAKASALAQTMTQCYGLFTYKTENNMFYSQGFVDTFAKVKTLFGGV